MSVRRELSDPWGWLVAGVCGGLGWAVLAGAAGPVALVAGVGIGATVLGAKVLVGTLRDGSSQEPDALTSPEPRDRLPVAPEDSPQDDLLDRSRAAVDRIADLSDRSGDPWIAGEVRTVLRESAGLVRSMEDLSGRVTLLDSSLTAAHPQRVAAEIAALQARLRTTSDPDLRREQEKTLAALDGQAASIDRLLSRRESLLSQLQAAAVGLEGLAARSGELVAMGRADRESESERLVGDLTTSLDGVRAGIDAARATLRDL